MKVRPLADRIAVVADAAEKQTAGGLFIPTKATDKTLNGTVVGVGPEAEPFAENDRVLFVSGVGSEVKLQDVTYTMLKVNEVVGIIKPDGLEPTHDNIVCVDAQFGDQQTSAGIIIKSNIKESQGITSRWMRVHKVGPDVDFVKPDQWVLVEYGRWTESFETDGYEKAYRVDPLGCIAVSDIKPETLYYNSDVIASEKKTL